MNGWLTRFRRVLVQEGVLHEPLRRVSARPLEEHLEYTRYEFEYHEQGESGGQDGDRFVIARVYLTVCHSQDNVDIDRTYHVMRTLRSTVSTAPGTFSDPSARIGDACYHVRFASRGIGFCRGNVVVEVSVAPSEWRDGRPKGVNPDTALKGKIVAAAREIDDVLLQEMFTPEVRQQILQAEAAQQ